MYSDGGRWWGPPTSVQPGIVSTTSCTRPGPRKSVIPLEHTASVSVTGSSVVTVTKGECDIPCSAAIRYDTIRYDTIVAVASSKQQRARATGLSGSAPSHPPANTLIYPATPSFTRPPSHLATHMPTPTPLPHGPLPPTHMPPPTHLPTCPVPSTHPPTCQQCVPERSGQRGTCARGVLAQR